MAGAAIAIPLGERLARANGAYIFPVTTSTQLRVMLGTAAWVVTASILALSAVSVTPSSHNGFYYQQFLELLEEANPVGEIHVVTDNLSSHNSKSTRKWLIDHPRIKHAFIPVGAC